MIRIGHGWDLHRLEEGRELWLGGIKIPSKKGAVAHSDGDVLLHALIDALLGALAKGDIGTLFPPSDPQWKDASSSELLRKTLDSLGAVNLHNIDASIILQEPKLKDWKRPIAENISSMLDLPVDRVSIKAKTHERVDAVGRGEAVEAMVSLLLSEE